MKFAERDNTDSLLKSSYFLLAYKEIFVQIEDYSAEIGCNRRFVLCHGINRNYTSR
jgi:hypothetical protein